MNRSMTGSERYDVCVVGAGVFGLATALELGRRGHSVALLEQFTVGHPAGSSTGASRGIRIAYNEPFYVALALDAIQRWRGLESETGHAVLHLTGQIDLGPDETLAAIETAVAQADAGIERLSAAELRRLMPELAPDPGSFGLFSADSGTVMAEQGMLALRAAALDAGVELRENEPATSIDASGPVTVTTARGSLRSDHVVIAAGPWSGPLLESLGIAVPLAPAIAQVTFLDATGMVDRPGITEWGAGGGAGIYGHPVPGIGYKVAYDAGAEGWQPDVGEWEPDLAEERMLLDWMAERMPGAPARVKLSQRHPWTMTPDGDFVVDRRGAVTLACGCSGHAFKFGPALGPLVADVLEGAAPQPLLALDRPGLRGTAVASAPITR